MKQSYKILCTLSILFALFYMMQQNNNSTQYKVSTHKPQDNRFFFKNTRFSADCCPSMYSSSNGCACMSDEQIDQIQTRGGNYPGDVNIW